MFRNVPGSPFATWLRIDTCRRKPIALKRNFVRGMTLHSLWLLALFAVVWVGCPSIQKFECDPVTNMDCEPSEEDDAGATDEDGGEKVEGDGGSDIDGGSNADAGSDGGAETDGGTELDGGSKMPTTCDACGPIAHGKSRCVDGGCIRSCDDGTLLVGASCEIPISAVVTVNSVCVLTEPGAVGCSGSANYLRNPKADFRLIPWPLPAPIKTLNRSKGSVCGMTAQGDAWCWGYNSDGILGNGTTNSFDGEPTLVKSGPFQTVSPGLTTSCGIRIDGGAACWGRNDRDNFSLGYTSIESIVTTPQSVSFQMGELAELKVEFSTWARNRAGEIYVWGARTGLENDPGPGTQPSARRLEFSFPVSALEIIAPFAIDTDGGVWVWGNTKPLLFNADAGPVSYVAKPVQTTCPPHVVQLCRGDEHACVRTVEGQVWCWGDNTHGQLGDGTFNSRGEPKPVPNLVATHLSCEGDFNCAATPEGVKCWGQNVSYRLGTVAPAKTATPLFISTPRN